MWQGRRAEVGTQRSWRCPGCQEATCWLPGTEALREYPCLDNLYRVQNPFQNPEVLCKAQLYRIRTGLVARKGGALPPCLELGSSPRLPGSSALTPKRVMAGGQDRKADQSHLGKFQSQGQTNAHS